MIKLTTIEKISLILKMCIGSAISWELAILFGSKYPYLGPISLIICLQATLFHSVIFGIARIVGTIIGVAFVSILASSLHASGWSITIIMLVSLIIPLLFGANSIMLNQIALSVMLVLEFEHKLPGYRLDRIRDSIIGVAVALLLHILLYPPNLTKRAIAEVEALPPLLANKLKSLATWLEAGASPKNYFTLEMNLFRKKMFEAEETIKKAELSLKFNPLSKKSKPLLHERKLLLNILKQVRNDIDVLFEIMDEWRKTGSLTKESMQAWMQIFSILASSLHDWNKGKAITAITFNETLENKKFHLPAMWHAQHIISTLQQHSYVQKST